MKLDVVFHVDLRDPQRLNLAFDNVQNYMNFLDTQTEPGKARVVMLGNGPAVNLFVRNAEGADLEARGKALMARGLDIRLCCNALKKFQIEPADLWEGCQPVSSGVPELLKLEAEGFGYVKP